MHLKIGLFLTSKTPCYLEYSVCEVRKAGSAEAEEEGEETSKEGGKAGSKGGPDTEERINPAIKLLGDCRLVVVYARSPDCGNGDLSIYNNEPQIIFRYIEIGIRKV